MKRFIIVQAVLSMAFSLNLMAEERPATAMLVTDASDLSRPFTVGVHFSLQPGWYLYWKNPGDAGLPVAVTWLLPEGFSAGDLEHPTPEKIIHGDIVAYGYYHDLLLTTTITPPPGYEPRTQDVITAKLHWLVCSESCIPGAASISMALVVPSDTERHRASTLLGTFGPRMPLDPGEIGIIVTEGHVRNTAQGRVISINLQGKGRGLITDFYPEPLEEAVIDFKNIRVLDGTITIPFTPYSTSAIIREVRGLAVAERRGYVLKCLIPQP